MNRNKTANTLFLVCLAGLLFVSGCSARAWGHVKFGFISNKSIGGAISFLPFLFLFYALAHYFFRVKMSGEECPGIKRFLGFVALDAGNLLVSVLTADILTNIFHSNFYIQDYLRFFLPLYFGLNCFANGLFLKEKGQGLKEFIFNKVVLLKIWKLNIAYIALLIPLLIASCVTPDFFLSEKAKHDLTPVGPLGRTIAGYLDGAYFDYDHCDIKQLVDKLKSQDETKRTLAENAIIARHDPNTMMYLDKLLVESEYGELEYYKIARGIIERAKDLSAVEPLIMLINDEAVNDVCLKVSAIRTLGNLPYSPRITGFLTEMKNNKEYSIREEAEKMLIYRQKYTVIPLAAPIQKIEPLSYTGNKVSDIINTKTPVAMGDVNVTAGKYILEIPHSGKDPRYEGKTYRFELTLAPDGTYELNTESPIVEYVKNIKTGVISEKLSVYHSNSGGNYTLEGNTVILSKPDPILGKDIKVIDGNLCYKDTKFKKMTKYPKTSELSHLDIQIGMERSKVENMVASALNTENKYSPYGNSLKGGIVKYADGHFILEIKYKAGAPAPLFINKQGNTQGLPPIDETIESIKFYETDGVRR